MHTLARNKKVLIPFRLACFYYVDITRELWRQLVNIQMWSLEFAFMKFFKQIYVYVNAFPHIASQIRQVYFLYSSTKSAF